MAVILVSPDGNQLDEQTVDFPAVWRHYLSTGFVYPAKLTDLAPVLDLIHAKWPSLLRAPYGIFQVHVMRSEGEINSSVAAFRDTDDTYLIHHAASRRGGRMIRCLQSCMSLFDADPPVQFISFYFQPKNPWTSRLEHNISALHPAQFTAALLTRDHFVYRSNNGQPGDIPAEIEILDEAAVPEIAAFLPLVIDPVRAASFGLRSHAHDLASLNAAYGDNGVHRFRRIYYVRRDGVIAAVAMCYTSDVPMNFSLLCNRTEIFVHPDVSDRAALVGNLVNAAKVDADRNKTPMCSLLIDSTDAQWVTHFVPTNKRYTNIAWQRDPREGWHAMWMGTEQLYEDLRAAKRALAT